MHSKILPSDEDVGESIDINEIREHQNPSRTSSEFDEAEAEVNQLILDKNGNPWSMNAPPSVGRRDTGNLFQKAQVSRQIHGWILFLRRGIAVSDSEHASRNHRESLTIIAASQVVCKM